MERVQKLLSARGVCSRRQAEEWIAQGRVTCNGAVCTLGQSVDPDSDIICVDGAKIPAPSSHVYIMLNKPKGYVTTLSDEKGRRDAAQLVKDCGSRVYPVGRLDMDSEGLLLFTNDGAFAHNMMHPSHRIDKTYRVTVRNCSEEGIARLLTPMTLDNYRLSKPAVQLISMSEGIFDITIHEGRNRQVRRMCAIAGMPVKRLVRVSEGPLKLGNLPSGTWRYLTKFECDELGILRQN